MKNSVIAILSVWFFASAALADECNTTNFTKYHLRLNDIRSETIYQGDIYLPQVMPSGKFTGCWKQENLTENSTIEIIGEGSDRLRIWLNPKVMDAGFGLEARSGKTWPASGDLMWYGVAGVKAGTFSLSE